MTPNKNDTPPLRAGRNIPMTLGERIHVIRRRRGMKQYVLAQAANVGVMTLSHLESGSAQDLRGQTIARLARTLRVRADYLLGLDYDDSEWTPDVDDEEDEHAA